MHYQLPGQQKGLIMMKDEQIKVALNATEFMDGLSIEGNNFKVTQFLSLREYLLDTIECNKQLVLALEKISNPINFLQEEAAKLGGKLDGKMAIEISNDAATLKEWARKALNLGITQPIK